MSLFSSNGCWTWFNDPRAIYHGGAYFVASVDSTGKQNVDKYYASGSKRVVRGLVFNGFGTDDHNNPGMIAMDAAGTNANKLLFCYCNHPGNADRKISIAEEGFSALGTNSVAYTSESYANIIQTGDSNHSIFWFSRDGTAINAPHSYGLSTDGGSTWGTRVVFFSTGASPYFQIIRRSSLRIDFLCTDNNPNSSVVSVYHFYMTLASNGATFTLKKSDGTTIGTYNIDGSLVSGTALPLGTANVTLVYNGATTNAWVWDLAEISGTLTGGISYYDNNSTSGSSGSHHYAIVTLNDGTGAWTKYDVCDGGGTGDDRLQATANNDHYSGGFALDPNNPLAIVASRKYGTNDFRLEKWTTTALGSAWSKAVDISGNTSSINARPVWCRDAPTTQWFYWRGTYTDYTSYSTDIYSYPDLTVNSSYTPAAKPATPGWDYGHAPHGCKGYWGLTEGSGTTAADNYPTDPHNGTFVSTPTWGTGSYGPEISGFSTTKYITIDPPTQLIQPGTTYPCWMAAMFKNSSTSDGVAFDQGRASSNTMYLACGRVNFNAVAQTFGCTATDDASHSNSPTKTSSTTNDGNYHACVWLGVSANDWRMYLDLDVIATASSSIGTTTSDRLTIGVLRRNTIALPFPGAIVATAIGSGDAPDPIDLIDDWLSGTWSALQAAPTGALSKTLDAVTISAQGTVAVQGALSKTLADITISADGQVVSSGVSGALDVILAGVTLQDAGTVAVTGSVIVTLGSVSILADGTVVSGIVGDLFKTLANVSITATGLSPGPSPVIPATRYAELTAYNGNLSLTAYN